MKVQNLEGLVAKRRGSKYEPGERSGAWQEMRVNQGREFVIGGYTTPQGARSEAQWKLRAGAVEHLVNGTAQVVRGGKMEVGRNVGVRFSLALT